MNPKTKPQLVTDGAALVAAGVALHMGVTDTVNHSALQGIWPIAKELLAMILPVVLAYVTRGPGHVKE